eukprot:COSAG05_NODE_7778_length_771_cov_0.806548_1_plen_83_part_00
MAEAPVVVARDQAVFGVNSLDTLRLPPRAPTVRRILVVRPDTRRALPLRGEAEPLADVGVGGAALALQRSPSGDREVPFVGG